MNITNALVAIRQRPISNGPGLAANQKGQAGSSRRYHGKEPLLQFAVGPVSQARHEHDYERANQFLTNSRKVGKMPPSNTPISKRTATRSCALCTNLCAISIVPHSTN